MAIEQSTLFQIFEHIAPSALAETWDNIGPHIILNPKRSIRKMLLCLDCYGPVIKEAIHIGAELIVAHHPLIFSPLSQFLYHQYPCALIQEMIQADISLYVMHTNLDKTPGGVNDQLAGIVGLSEVSPLFSEENGPPSSGLGRIGNFPRPKKLARICHDIKEKLGLQRIRFIGDPEMVIKRVAVCSGSGAGLIQESFKKGAQGFLTGDVRYHQAREAQGYGLALIDAGHFATERIILPVLKDRIIKMLGDYKDLEIHICDSEEDPFHEL